MLTLRRAVVLGALLTAAGTSLTLGQNIRTTGSVPGGEPTAQPTPDRVSSRSDRPTSGLVARQRLPKIPTEQIRPVPGASGRLVVKFTDEVKARTLTDGRIRSDTERDLSMVNLIMDECGAECRPAFGTKSASKLAQIETRAAVNSGKAQPDLGGMMYITGVESELQRAAIMLNELDEVEFVYFEPRWTLPDGRGDGRPDNDPASLAGSGGGGGGGSGVLTGACCSEGTCFVATNAAECFTFNGNFAGPGTDCSFTGWPMGGDCEGACCLDDGTCVDLTAAFQCENGLGGAFQGSYTDCSPTSCEVQTFGACCVSDTDCQDNFTEEQCMMSSGETDAWFMGQTCAGDQMSDPVNCEDPDCDVAGTGNCFEVNGSLFCEAPMGCCTVVCNFDPFCCDENVNYPGRGQPTWDAWCTQQAFNLCNGEDPTVVCGNATSGECFLANGTPGCEVAACCQAVCDQQDLCCSTAWDLSCADLAFDLCGIAGACEYTDPDDMMMYCVLVLTEEACTDAVMDGGLDGTYLGDGSVCPGAGGMTASYVGGQGYLTAEGYTDPIDPTIDTVLPKYFDPDSGMLEILPGFEGEGYDLQGLWEIGEVLLSLGVGTENLTRGRTVKAGVIEFSAFVDWQAPNDPTKTHEDLINHVVPEPNQTQIILAGGSLLSGTHGTACLGIIGAVDHDDMGNPEPPGLSPDQSYMEEVGCVGIAPEAELYFFPTVSVEQPAGRLLDAIASALTVFGPGDVLNFSIGPGGCGTLASSPGEWTMLRMAADLGVTCSISAGNDCCDLTGSPQFMNMDSDCIVVGAVYPGGSSFNSYCRLPFSNYCTACAPGDAVHISAWGTLVTTLGGNRDLAWPGFENTRSYTNTFNGTSASSPQVVGLVACLQGLAKQFFEIPITPAQIRQIISLDPASARQCAAQSAATLPGTDGNPCLGDWDPQGEKHFIGDSLAAYTLPFFAGEQLIASGFFDGNPFVNDLVVVRGQHLFGNTLSIRSSDDNYFVLRSRSTTAGNHPDSSDYPPFLPLGQGILDDITYIVNGQVSDVVVVAEVSNTDTTVLNIVYELTNYGLNGLVFVELYNIYSRRWTFVAVEQLGLADPDQDIFAGINVGRAQSYINQDNGEVYVRLWTFGFGEGGIGAEPFGSENDSPYDVQWDFVGVSQGQGFGTFGN